LPERTDNDIKNYWNTHLKKKLTMARAQDGTGRTSTHHRCFSKGQWERRLQTDIHTAKQALHNALAIDEQKPPSNGDLKPYHASSSSSTNACNVVYASSTENISKLLQGWMRSSPNKPRANRCDSDSSQGSLRCESVSSRDERKPLSWLENWLFEDGAAGQDEMPNLESLQLPLDDPTEFFL
jgi:transcription factor MYB, plant